MHTLAREGSRPNWLSVLFKQRHEGEPGVFRGVLRQLQKLAVEYFVSSLVVGVLKWVLETIREPTFLINFLSSCVKHQASKMDVGTIYFQLVYTARPQIKVPKFTDVENDRKRINSRKFMNICANTNILDHNLKMKFEKR